MSRIESRPAKARSARWEYVFFVDVEGHQADAKVAARSASSRHAATLPQDPGVLPHRVELRHRHEDGSLRTLALVRALDRALPARQADFQNWRASSD